MIVMIDYKAGNLRSVAKALEAYMKGEMPLETAKLDMFQEHQQAEHGGAEGPVQAPIGPVGVCPDCGNPMVFEEGCKVCKNCGYSTCG